MLTATGITGRSGAFPPHHFVSYSGEYLSKVLECTRGYLTYGLRGQQSQIRDPPKALRAGWTPTDLAQELDKSRNTVYNHLESLYDQGVLTKTQVAAKTRPKTEYSIEDGFMQYIAVLPGHYKEKSLELTPEKQTVLERGVYRRKNSSLHRELLEERQERDRLSRRDQSSHSLRFSRERTTRRGQ
jgi:DNA-binding transcriptional ArsR family regulator